MDFLIYYESKTRELECDCLLENELKRRGYSVEIVSEFSAKRTFLDPKVLIVPYLYGNDDIDRFNRFWKRDKRGIVNLQYEQVLSKKVIESGFHIPKDFAQNATHICWGQKTYDRLSSFIYNKSLLPVTGHMGMDLNRKELSNCLFSKRKLGDATGIDCNKNWHLFISSFVIDSLSEKELERLKEKGSEVEQFYMISADSKKKTLVWLEDALRAYPDTIIIYRPHPAEAVTRELLDMVQKYDNFVCIKDYSIREWIAVVDTMSTWFSTSVVDAYFAEKDCCILRPIKIPDEFEDDVMMGAVTINSSDEFLSYLSSETKEFPIEAELIETFYGIKDKQLIVDKVADVCEQVLNERRVFDPNYTFKQCLKTCFVDIFASVVSIMPDFKINTRWSVFCRKMKKEKKDTSHWVEFYRNRFRMISDLIFTGGEKQ